MESSPENLKVEPGAERVNLMTLANKFLYVDKRLDLKDMRSICLRQVNRCSNKSFHSILRNLQDNEHVAHNIWFIVLCRLQDVLRILLDIAYVDFVLFSLRYFALCCVAQFTTSRELYSYTIHKTCVDLPGKQMKLKAIKSRK